MFHVKFKGEYLVFFKVGSDSLQALQQVDAGGVVVGTLQEGVLQAVHPVPMAQVTQGRGGDIHSE